MHSELSFIPRSATVPKRRLCNIPRTIPFSVRAAWVATMLLATAGPTRADDEAVPPAPGRDDPPRVFVSGVADTFTKTREAIASAKAHSGRDYRVIVVDEPGAADAAALLERIVRRWREESPEDAGGFNPAADVTIVLDVGDRRIAMDVPWSLEASAGLDRRTLEAELIASTFVPKAKDGLYDEGLADLVAGSEDWIRRQADERARKAEAARVFRTRTLPLGAAGLLGAGLAGTLAVQWTRHGRRLRAAREKLAAFKSEVVALSDLLDGQQERHRMLPHSDADFKTPMQGMTRATYDDVQGAIRRYRERWLGLMDVWERAQEKIDSEWFLGTAAADEAVRLLDSAEARPPLDAVAGECRAPLDALEQAHEQAREAASSLDHELAAASARIDALAQLGRSGAAFQPAVAEVARGRQLAGDVVESDPVAARGRLEEGRTLLAATVERIDAAEAADGRRRAAAAQADAVREQVRARRADGWLLAEPGANPDDRLGAADENVTLAAQLLDAGQTQAALANVERAEAAAAEARALVESMVAAKARAEELLPTAAARLDALAARRRAAATALERLAAAYAESSWADVADNLARADDGGSRAQSLVLEARAAVEPARQHYLAAVAELEEALRQEDWAEGCLTAIADRLAELDGLRDVLPVRRDRTLERIAGLERQLERQRTDRIRANERCREAARIIHVADQGLAAARPDLRQAAQLVEAADTAVARGEELAAEDERLALQAASDLEETDALLRRVAAWYAEGVQADVRSAASGYETAKALLSRQRYEDSIRAAADASQQARLAYATATAEAERRRLRRQQELQRRQLEESFARMSRGAGPWVVQLPGGVFTGPDPWRSLGASPRTGGSTTASGGWSRDVAQVGW